MTHHRLDGLTSAAAIQLLEVVASDHRALLESQLLAVRSGLLSQRELARSWEIRPEEMEDTILVAIDELDCLETHKNRGRTVRAAFGRSSANIRVLAALATARLERSAGFSKTRRERLTRINRLLRQELEFALTRQSISDFLYRSDSPTFRVGGNSLS